MQRCIAVVCAVAFWATPALAKVDVTFTFDPAGDVFADALTAGQSVADIEQELEDNINAQLSLLNPEDFLTSFADAASLSNRGLGADYASHPDLFMLGVGLSAAIGNRGDLGETPEGAEQPTIPGLGLNVSLMAGFRVTDRLTVYGNFFRMPETTIEGDDGLKFTGKGSNIGAHAQYTLFAPEGDLMELLFRWGGFSVTSGIEMSKMTLALDSPFPTEFPLSGSSAAGDVTYLSTGKFEIESTAFTIPVELTTNVRLLYFVSLYAGVGLDFQLGKGKMEASLDGDVVGNVGGTQYDIGTANITAKEEGNATPAVARLIGGVQLNLTILRAFIQANVQKDRGVVGTFGLGLIF